MATKPETPKEETTKAVAGTHIKRGEKVELENKELGTREFTGEEAETLLNLPQNTGLWALPSTSKYQFSDGKIINGGGTATTGKA